MRGFRRPADSPLTGVAFPVMQTLPGEKAIYVLVGSGTMSLPSSFLESKAMSEPIHLVVTLQVKPGQMEKLQQVTAELVQASVQEAGCVSYRSAYAEDGVTAYIVEHWQDQAALDAHNQTRHFIEGVKKLQDTCSTLQIHRVYWQN